MGCPDRDLPLVLLYARVRHRHVICNARNPRGKRKTLFKYLTSSDRITEAGRAVTS